MITDLFRFSISYFHSNCFEGQPPSFVHWNPSDVEIIFDEHVRQAR